MRNKKNKNLKLYFIVSFLSIFMFSFLIFYIFEIRISNIKLEELKENEEDLVNIENQLMGKEFRMILGDLHYLHHVYDQNLYDSKNHNEISFDWIEFSNQRRIYDQIRYIDKNGQEKIRINYDDNNGAYLVEEFQLQNKKDRYYFYETAKLDEEDVYVSPLDLNIENSKIEIPFKPMLRFSTSLYDQNGEFKGIIILNYLAESILSDFKELGKNSSGNIALLNSDGYWLVCEDEDNEWNFMFEDKKDITFSRNYPEEWERIKKNKGQIITENGLFTFATVHLNHQYTQGDKYEVDNNITYSDGEWYIVSLISTKSDLASYFSSNPLLIIKNTFKNNNYQLILLGIISAIAGLFIYLNRRKYHKIKYYSEYDTLTKTFNRRSGYEKINKLIYKNDRRKILFSLCFIDVNGLKQVNDHLGHKYGDELLTTVSDVIRFTVRQNDFTIRVGGDEFLIVLDGIGEEQSEKIWERIVSKFEEININSNRPYIISVSHGIVEYNNVQKTEVDDLIRRADEKMYKEKKIIKENLNVLR